MQAVEFYIGKSRLLKVLLVFIYSSALFSLSLLAVSNLLKIFLDGFLVYFLVKNCNLHVNRTAPQAIVKVWQDSKGAWGFETVKKLKYKAKLLPDSYHSRFLTILRFKTSTKTFNVVISSDSLSQNEYRILRCHLVFF